MKKKFYSLLMIGAMLLPTACSYDDAELWNAVGNLDQRVENLEESVNRLNSNVDILSQLMSGKMFITSIEDQGDGVRIVHMITDNGTISTIEIRDGKDGATGATGDKGETGDKGDKGDKGDTGATGATPVVSIKQDSDGNYYWTVNGEYLLDANGQKVRANGLDGAAGADGKDGQDGQDGQDGKDGQQGKTGIAPAFRIENGKWFVSLDRGLTWTEIGTATGADGDSFFKDACQSDDGTLAYLTLADGTVLTLPIYSKFDIAFDVENALIQEGQTKDIPFTVTGMTKSTPIEALGKKGWDADARLNPDGSGTLTVSAPVSTGPGKVIVLVSDGDQKTIMRTLSFVAGQVLLSTQAVNASAENQSIEVTVQTNLDFTVNVPADATWVRMQSGRSSEMRTETFTLSIDANESPETRQALITLENNGLVVESIRVVQESKSFNANELIFVVDPTKGNPTTGVCLPLYYIAKGAGSVFVDWGDGSEVQELKPNSATTTYLVKADQYPKHIYTDQSRQYTVRVWGNLTAISGNNANYVKGIVGIVQWGTGFNYTTVSITNNPDITYLPGVVANEFANVTNMSFQYLSGLKRVSPDLCKGAKSLDNIQNLFRKCTELEELPPNLFDDCINARALSNMFDGCTKLRNVPSFANTTKVSSLSVMAMFRDCESLTELPEVMWPEKFMQQVNNVNTLFQNCKSLTRIPENFFKGLGEGVTSANKIVAITSANNMFDGCENLEYVNFEPLFNSPGMLQNYGFSNMFRGCSKLTGSVPSYKFEYNGSTYDVAPWQRLEYVTSSDADMATAAKAVFGTRTSHSTGGAFSECNSLDNYMAIPASWGGGDDGLSGLPQIRIEPELPEGKEYYQIDFHLYGKDVQELYYLLTTTYSLERNLPLYGNSLEQMIIESGEQMRDSYDGFKVANVNTDEGITLGWEGGMPEVEYALIVMAKNVRGSKVTICEQATQAMPRGSDEYEAYVGTWTVTPDGATSEVTAEDVPAPPFEITIVPNRVDQNYAIYGWGYSILSQYPFMLTFNPSTKALEMWNGIAGATNVISSYKFGKEDNPDAMFEAYNAVYAPIIEDPSSGMLSFWSPRNNECILAGKYIKSTDTVTLTGQRSASVSSDTGMDAYWASMEMQLAMGSPGGVQSWTPVQIIRPEYRFVYEGKEYTP
ncbi:MAG: hypothetical protein K2L49_04010, partial [Muribaculaceae bacterium]|nr:hypothetical protein [Muribaculaceae bacterium]